MGNKKIVRGYLFKISHGQVSRVIATSRNLARVSKKNLRVTFRSFNPERKKITFVDNYPPVEFQNVHVKILKSAHEKIFPGKIRKITTNVILDCPRSGLRILISTKIGLIVRIILL